MKHTIKFLLLFGIVTSVFCFGSCKDKFDDSIFNTSVAQDYLDKSAYTFPLDTFCKVEYLEPYNLKFLYKFEDKGSDMNKNLTPAKYDKCVDLAVLSKYLWYDIYKNLGGVAFLKAYSPRIIAVTGSKNLNASQGTEVLGDASGGVKINLYNVNELNVGDIDMMNEYFFKTMHHEFAHILNQTYSRPAAFNIISNGRYDSNWSESSDSLKAGIGFVSAYASSAIAEDWAEIMANYITRDSLSWNTLMGSASYDWEEVDPPSNIEDSTAFFNKYGRFYKDTVGLFKQVESGENKIVRRVCKRDDAGYVVFEPNTKSLFSGSMELTTKNPTFTIPNVDWTTVKAGNKIKITADVKGSAEGTSFSLINGSSAVVVDGLKFETTVVTLSVEVPITDAMLTSILSTSNPSLSIKGTGFTVKKVELEGTPTPQWTHESGINGVEVIKQKLDLARSFMKEHFNIDLDALRRQVQDNAYVKDETGKFVVRKNVRKSNGFISDGLVNKLTSKQDDGRQLIEHLRDYVNQYKALQK